MKDGTSMLFTVVLALATACGPGKSGGIDAEGSGSEGSQGKTSAGTDGATSTSGGVTSWASGPGGSSAGGDGTSGGSGPGTTGGTGGVPADEGRCPGWTEQVLAEACATAEAGEVTVATRKIYAIFEVEHEFAGAAQLIRVPLTEVPDEDKAGLEQVALRLQFSNGAQSDVWRAMAVFAVDNDLEAGFVLNSGIFTSGARIDASSCEAIRRGRAMDPAWGDGSIEGDTLDLVPDAPKGHLAENIPWDQDVHFVVVTRPPECMGASEPPGEAGQVVLPRAEGERIGGVRPEEPGPCGGGW